LDVEVESVSIDDPNARAELLLLSPTVLTPRLDHKGASIWDTIAIAEYLEEEFPNKGLLPLDKKPRSHARSIIGEMHGGYNLRSALPMNLRAVIRASASSPARGRHPPYADDLERVL
jgi:glutathione S-transferase